MADSSPPTHPIRGLALAAGALAAALLIAPGAASQTAPYDLVDNIEDNYVNLHPIPVRPMALSDDGGSLWACNPYNSDVARIDGSLTVVQRFRTLWGPVAIAQYAKGSVDVLIVVCQHSNAAVIHDRTTGDIEAVVTLPPEPADVVVDTDNDRAFSTLR